MNLISSELGPNNTTDVISELINLKAIMSLPKGTEHFMSDLHGEYEAFQHVLRNASGGIKEKIDLCFNKSLTHKERKILTFIVYYPEDMLTSLKVDQLASLEQLEWYSTTILQLTDLIDFVATKYTRSKVRKALPANFTYVAEELLYRDRQDLNKRSYFQELITEIVRLNQAPQMIIGLAYTVQRLVVDHLHIVGDIFDRGPAPDKIIETLIAHHSLDVQWGNHDITWIGANSGSPLCIMNVIRISARYNNLAIIEDVYGINLRPLQTFAEEHYQDNPNFRPKISKNEQLTSKENLQITQIQQAVAMIQFKLESQLIKRRPDFKMEHRLLLEKIDYQNNTIDLKGQTYPLTKTCFQTVDPLAPDKLTVAEMQIVTHLIKSFTTSEKLKRHVNFLMKKGSMYLCYNNNLLIHGCIPLNPDGSFKTFTIAQNKIRGKELLDTFESALRKSHQAPTQHEDLATDLVWYLWTGEASSLFGKNEMTTFERYFIDDQNTHKEIKNDYYHLRNEPFICDKILGEFGLSLVDGHIINGHTPIKEIEGETPVKAQGKMLVIDGGFSKPYQATTGIAGYTLTYNSYGMQLVAHQPFHSKEQALTSYSDIVSTKRIVDRVVQRKKVSDTTIGAKLQKEITALETLLLQLEKNIL